MKARRAFAFALMSSLLLGVTGCTGGVFVQYPLFPDRSCATCLNDQR